MGLNYYLGVYRQSLDSKRSGLGLLVDGGSVSRVTKVFRVASALDDLDCTPPVRDHCYLSYPDSVGLDTMTNSRNAETLQCGQFSFWSLIFGCEREEFVPAVLNTEFDASKPISRTSDLFKR